MRKYDLISALSAETSREVTRNEESWKKYLNTASRLYKYPFKDQLLIYAQRPDATACASIEIWNEKMHCWVNKGAKGIALLDEEGSPYTGLRYVFDISDVHKARRIGRFTKLWEMNPTPDCGTSLTYRTCIRQGASGVFLSFGRCGRNIRKRF